MANPLLDMPSNWQHITLEPDKQAGYITSVDSGGTPSTTNEEYWDGEIPWITPKDITGLTDTVYVAKTERNITKIGLKDSGAKLLDAGCVLLTKRAPVGLVVVNSVPMSTNQGFLNFRCGPKLDPLYLAYWLKVNRKYLEMVANGSTYPELYKSDLFEFQIAVPPFEEQKQILNIIKAIQHIKLISIFTKKSLLLSNHDLTNEKEENDLNEIELIIIKELMSGKINVAKAKERLKKHG